MPVEIDDIVELVRELDVNGDGMLSPQEVKNAIDQDDELVELIGSLANSRGLVMADKVIEFFIMLEEVEDAAETGANKRMLTKLYNFIDENGDGKLSDKEVKIGLKRFNLWDDVTKEIFNSLKGQDGKVKVKGT